MDFLMLERWSPYLVGILIGLLNVLSLLVSKKPLGASTSFMKLGGMIYRSFDREKVQNNEYYQKNELKLDWGMMLVFGIIIGAFVSAMLSGDFNLIAVPGMWANEVSGSFGLRFVSAVLGGVFLGVGARWAGGCPAGYPTDATPLSRPCLSGRRAAL